jgi:hypothetical protein
MRDILCETTIDVIVNGGDDSIGVNRDAGTLIIGNSSKRSHIDLYTCSDNNYKSECYREKRKKKELIQGGQFMSTL